MIAWCFANWRLVLELAVAGVLVVYGITMRTERDIARAEYSDFRREVAIAAQAASEAALKKTIADQKRKDEADAENLRLHAAVDAATRKLRDARAGSNFLPSAPSCPGRPDSAAFDRTLLERALRDFDSEVQGLLDEGGRAVVDLDTAKRWAQGR